MIIIHQIAVCVIKRSCRLTSFSLICVNTQPKRNLTFVMSATRSSMFKAISPSIWNNIRTLSPINVMWVELKFHFLQFLMIFVSRFAKSNLHSRTTWKHTLRLTSIRILSSAVCVRDRSKIRKNINCMCKFLTSILFNFYHKRLINFFPGESILSTNLTSARIVAKSLFRATT